MSHNSPNESNGKFATPSQDVCETKENLIIRVIQNYYSVPKTTKPPSQIETEKWLIPNCIEFNRWCLLPAAFIIQFCCGSLYAWSVFNKPIDNYIFGENRNTAPITFYIAVGFLGFAAALMGPWLERNGPKKACLLGTTLFLTGNLLTALALYLKWMWLVFIAYGIIGAFGLGICYISPVSALQKWFPDRRGLGAGFAVCGYGAGSIGIAKVQIPLIATVGLPLTFVVLGSCYFIAMATCAFILRTPPPDYDINFNKQESITQQETSFREKETLTIDVEPKLHPDPAAENPAPQETFTLIEALTSRDFRFIMIMFTGNIVFGLVLISRLSNIITDVFDKLPEEASTIVSINGGFNLAGRLLVSIISDYVGRKNCYIFMLTTQLIILGCFSIMTNAKAYWAFLITMWIITACYGAGFGVIPAFLTDKFGPSNTGACHGIILTGWSTGGVLGGVIFTTVFDSVVSSGYSAKDPWPYNLNVWWIFGLVCISWIALMFVKPTKLDEKFNRKICCKG